MRSCSPEGILFVSYMFARNKCKIQNFTQNTDFQLLLKMQKVHSFVERSQSSRSGSPETRTTNFLPAVNRVGVSSVALQGSGEKVK